MCMLDYSDGAVSMIGDEWRKAKKEHRCKECKRTIEPGERYSYETFHWDGEFHVHKTCEHCIVVRDWLQAECGGWLFGGVEEDFDEHSNKYGRADLLRISVGMDWKWCGPSGRLLPVPAMPPTTFDLRQAAQAAATGSAS